MLLVHYTMMAQIGLAQMEMHAFRCSVCSEDFHCDRTPRFCPCCGIGIIGVRPFGGKSDQSKS